MSKRNFILLVIVLVVIVIAVFGFLYFRRSTTTAPGDNTGTNFGSIFNPFGNTGTTPPNTTPPADVSGYQPNPVDNTLKLKKVSSMPIAGFTVYLKERLVEVPIVIPPPENTPATKPVPPATEFVPALRYVERATGNIYETFADKIEERKFSTTVIPKIYEALFGNNGDAVVMRYVKEDGKTIETFVASLPKEMLGGDTTSNNEVRGSFLPENMKDVSLSPDNSSMFYSFESGDSLAGTTFNFTTTKKTQIFSSPFTEWLSLWPKSSLITLTTKPASAVPGYMYGLDPVSKNFNKIIGGVSGLTTLASPDGKLVLYADDGLNLSMYHVDTKASVLAGARTLPEKCVWGKASNVVYCAVPTSIPSGQYPDSWYQGEVSFSDQIWKLDAINGNATLVADPVTIGGGAEIDGIKLAMDAGENYLFFVNKKDSYLWELKLK